MRNPKGPLPPQESVELSVGNRATMQRHEGSANKNKAAIRAKNCGLPAKNADDTSSIAASGNPTDKRARNIASFLSVENVFGPDQLVELSY
jgi:hypothetical protein